MNLPDYAVWMLKLWKNTFACWSRHTLYSGSLIEEEDGNLTAWEFKFSIRKTVKKPSAFASAYPDARFTVITPENVDFFLLPQPGR